MRFLLYNVRYCTGGKEGFHFPFPQAGYFRKTGNNLHRLGSFIQSWDPDIVGLVEMDMGSYRSARRNQVKDLAKTLGHFHSYHSKYGAKSLQQHIPVMNKQGNAFLTKNTIQHEHFHYFSRGVKRLVIELELEELTIFLVHLSLKFRHRQEQLNHLYEILRSIDKPHLVAGDFNSFWGEKEIQLFLAATGLQNANEHDQPSYPSWAPRRQLDFVLYSEGIQVRKFMIPQVTLSDHLPLLLDFEVASPASATASPPLDDAMVHPAG